MLQDLSSASHCLFVLLLYIPVKSYGHVGMVVLLTTLYILGMLEHAANQYFVHILSLLERISGWEVNDHGNYFTINLYKSMGSGRD